MYIKGFRVRKRVPTPMADWFTMHAHTCSTLQSGTLRRSRRHRPTPSFDRAKKVPSDASSGTRSHFSVDTQLHKLVPGSPPRDRRNTSPYISAHTEHPSFFSSSFFSSAYLSFIYLACSGERHIGHVLPDGHTARGDYGHLMMRRQCIVPQSEVIRAILLKDSPCCEVPHLYP